MKINKKIEVQNLNELFDITCSNRTEYSSCWLNVSINNYNTAFVLFKNNIYCHAIFFMQQSIECLIKAILIENNLISFSDIKSANHRPEQALDEYLIDKKSETYNTFLFIKDKIYHESNFEKKFQLALNIINDCTKQTNVIITKDDSNTQLHIHYLINLHIYTLSILLGQLEQKTRYPNDNNETPNVLFDGSQIIKEIVPLLLECLEHCIRRVCEIKT